ncbi:hypothetical protein BaRGS_00030697 [Batillaria attramentaria]|uniref:AIG1-type G domain-containing protein n=1 Tax=Batillaria attramentaria TaxID=370345 RepID=A0ABD0JTB9_9CAEN
MFEDKENRFLIVVFARDGEPHGKRIEDEIADAPKILKTVLEMVGNKYAVISKTDDENQKRKEVETLLAMIDSVSNDCKDFYKNDSLKKMIELINEEIDKVMKEKDLKWFEAEVLVKKELIKEKEKRFESQRRKHQALVLVTTLIGSLMDITSPTLWAEYLIKTAAAVKSAESALEFPIKVAELGKFLVEKRGKQKNKCCIS